MPFSFHKQDSDDTFFCLGAFCLCAVGQEFNLLSQPTDAPKLIPDTRISIIPPPDYNISERFAGLEFQGRPETAIIVATIPGPFSTTIRRFNKDIGTQKYGGH